MNVIYNKNNFLSLPDGDYRKTEKKLVWVSDKYCKIDILFIKNNLLQEKKYMGECDMANLKVGDYLQIFKLGYFKCIRNDHDTIKLIEISN